MNTFWLKIAVFLVVILVIVVVVNNVSPPKEDTPKPTKTFYDVAEKDKERLSSEPRPEDFVESPPPQQEQTEPVEPMKLYFKEISEIEQIEAERLLNAAVPARSMGRLQIGYNLMIKNCRQIMERWPDTLYDYKARRMLKDIPERFHSRYKMTAADIDLTRFTQPKPGTKVFIMEEEQ